MTALHVVSSAMRTTSKPSDGLATIAATIAWTLHSEVQIERIKYIGDQQRIANVIQRGNTEQHIVNGTHSRKVYSAEQRLAKGETMEDVVESSQRDYKYCPNESHKSRQFGRQRKWIESRMIIKMPPRVGGEKLY